MYLSIEATKAGAVIGSTIAEDYACAGIGVIDDPASLALVGKILYDTCGIYSIIRDRFNYINHNENKKYHTAMKGNVI